MSLERFNDPVIRPFSANITNLPGAKLWFYAPNTTTPKVVYQDKFGLIPHTNPVVADSIGAFAPIFLSGLYRVSLTDANDIVQDGWPVDNVGNDSDNAVFGPWSETYNYAINDIAYGSNAKWYRSIVADNLGNDPISSPEEWTEIPFIGFYNEFETYSEDEIAIFDGTLWSSLQDENTGNTPAFGSAWWGNATGLDLGTAAEADLALAGDLDPQDDEALSVGLFDELALYKGPWEQQTGEAIPPYWVDYGVGNNYALKSEGLDEAEYSRANILSVVDSGIAAPVIDGRSFGNYWKITPNTTNGLHTISQTSLVTPDDGSFSLLVRGGGYSALQMRLTTAASGAALAEIRFDTATGDFSLNTGLIDINARDFGGGEWLITASWSGISNFERIFLYCIDNSGNASFAGNGTDGILATRVQVSEPGARYVKTTTAAIPYTPPKIYELQQYQSDVLATEPGTDETVWLEVGTGGGSGDFFRTAALQTFTSADEVANNISVDLDASVYNAWQLDFNGSPLPSTSGNYNITLINLPNTPEQLQIYQVRTWRAGRKTVVLAAENESAATVTVSAVDTLTYGSASGNWDVLTFVRWPGTPTVVQVSLSDGRR